MREIFYKNFADVLKMFSRRVRKVLSVCGPSSGSFISLMCCNEWVFMLEGGWPTFWKRVGQQVGSVLADASAVNGRRSNVLKIVSLQCYDVIVRKAS